MKLSQIRDDYYDATGKLSDVVRQLDFAGIGVVWIFAVGKDTDIPKFAPYLVIPLACFVASLAFDLLQYAYKSVMLEFVNRHFWNKFKSDDAEVSFKDAWNWPTIIFFWLKAFFVVSGYISLMVFIVCVLIALARNKNS